MNLDRIKVIGIIAKRRDDQNSSKVNGTQIKIGGRAREEH